MTQNKIQPDVIFGGEARTAVRPGIGGRAGRRQRVAARLFAGRYDRAVESGVRVRPDTALAAHVARLVSDSERHELANTLSSVLRLARSPGGGLTHRVPVRHEAVADATVADVIEDVTSRLGGPGVVRERGVARLRMLLTDGAGPLYQADRGSLAAAFRGVLAAL